MAVQGGEKTYVLGRKDRRYAVYDLGQSRPIRVFGGQSWARLVSLQGDPYLFLGICVNVVMVINFGARERRFATIPNFTWHGEGGEGDVKVLDGRPYLRAGSTLWDLAPSWGS